MTRPGGERSRPTSAAQEIIPANPRLALVLEGTSRTQAAQAAGMDRQTLRDWVHRYNEDGLAASRM